MSQPDNLQQLYESFDDGFVFEEFLKCLLIKMGLQDVAVTRKTGDGGVDLTAVRPGLDALSRVDEVRYKVQAKRYMPDRCVDPAKVHALHGVLEGHEKGLLITTARFSPDTEEWASQRPLLLIDGTRLVDLCIEHELGFRFEPVFDRALLNLRATSARPVASPAAATQAASTTTAGDAFLRPITANDIRARIISLPRALGDALGNVDRITVEFPPHFPPREYIYNRDRMYVAGVTEVLRKFQLIGADDSRHPKLAEWKRDPGASTISVVIRDTTA